MKAVCLLERERIEIRDIEEPRPGPRQVAVRPEHVGLCGTDLHVYLGQFEERVRYPAILGHELVGVIVEKGAEAKGLEVGERVVVDPVLPCRACPLCRAGRFNQCLRLAVIGLDSPGGLAERIVVDRANVLRLPGTIDPAHAVMAELYAVAVHASRITNIEAGDVVVIIGAGRLGLSLLDVMRHAGAARIVSVDILDGRLAVAKKIGADLTINPRHADPAKEVMSLTGGLGADKVIEAVGLATPVPGRKPPMQTAVAMLRPGGQITAMGQPEEEEPFAWRPLVLKEATVVTSRLNLGDMPRAVEMMASGTLHPAEIISHTVAPEEVGRGFEMMHSRPESVIKVAVDMGRWRSNPP